MPTRKRPASSHTRTPWERTWLWETLETRAKARDNDHAREFLPTLKLWLVQLDTVLRSAGTTPLDFTLHDADHALRVADRMGRLISSTPVRRNISDYELALLLLSAYGHDIGMSPARKKVQQHYQYLFGHDTGLTDAEKARYQEFLDNYADQPVTLPLGTSLAHLNLADELTAYYVRERHNDWSGEWLSTHLTTPPGGGFGFLPEVISILVRLCASHHWGFDRLAAPEFQPFLSTGPHPQLVHLRYLACILRLADILENDPERTPEVILRHRSIGERGRSLVHWQKDHALSIVLGGDRLYFQARPRTAVAHKALFQLADWIDHELQGIAAFGGRLPQQWTLGERKIEREWHIAPAVTRDIQPVPGTYEYIEGAFRPNTSRLLALLSNEQLYGRPIVAVRELLQNAFDAVREKIARRRLEPHIDDAADPKWEEKFGDEEKVTLILRPDAQGRWQLVCEDTGVGLTKALITGHLLISGQSRRHAILDLERQCAARGFQPGLTGQFGIGVLSYFMLAESLTLETSRHQGCRDLDGAGWHFATSGAGSFGELRRLDSSPFATGGTRLTWQLRKDRISEPAAFARELLTYLKETLIRLPCRFELRTEGLPGSDVLWQRPWGWVKTAEDWMQRAQEFWKEPEEYYGRGEGYLSAKQKEEWEAKKVRYPSDLAAARSSLRCEFLEVTLPGGVGTARLVLRYFELPKGRCLQPCPEIFEDWVHHHEERFRVPPVSESSWKGIACPITAPTLQADGSSAIEEADFSIAALSVELDVVAGPSDILAVSRFGATVTAETVEHWTIHIWESGSAWMDGVLASGASEFYHEVNLSRQGRPLTLREGCGWYHIDEGQPFRALQRPFALKVGIRFHLSGTKPPCCGLKTSSGEVIGVISLKNAALSNLANGFEMRVLPSSTDGSTASELFGYWSARGKPLPAYELRVPPEWTDVALLSSGRSAAFLCVEHPIVRLMSPADMESLRARELDMLEALAKLDAATTAATAALALCQTAVQLLGRGLETAWDVYVEQRSAHLRHLWQLIASASATRVEQLRLYAVSSTSSALLSYHEYRSVNNTLGEPSLLPLVTDPAWLLSEAT